MKKYIFGAVLSLSIFISPPFTHAAELTRAQITSILSLLWAFNADSATLGNVNAILTGINPSTIGGPNFCHTFTVDMSIRDSGAEVNALQTALQREGYALLGEEGDKANGQPNGIFGEATSVAVIAFQNKYKIQPATGYVGFVTRGQLNKLYGCNKKPS